MAKNEDREEKTNPELSPKSWFDKSEEDLKAAQAMLDAHRYTWCAYICQQAIEKYLKAWYVKKFNEIPPYIHKLEKLCKRLGLEIPEKLLDSIVRIDRYYIATRYPTYKEEIGISNYEEAKNIYNKTKEILKWLKEELETQKKLEDL